MDYQKTKNAKTNRPKWGGGDEYLGPCTKLNQKCMVKSGRWPHQNVLIYFSYFLFSLFKYKVASFAYSNTNLTSHQTKILN